MERGAPRREGLLKLKFGTVCQIFSFFLQRKFCGQDTEYAIFLLKREPHQTGYFADVGLRSPLLHLCRNFQRKGGSVTACGYCGGIAPRGYLRGSPLDTPFVSFLVKGKIPRCGARSSTKGRFAETLVWGKTQNIFTAPKQNQILKESVIHSLFSFLVKLDIERVSQMC